MPRRCETVNVHTALAALRKSALVAEREAGGRITLLGGVYDIRTGAVAFLED